MLDARSRVTVIGARRRVDVALPSAAPVGEYSAGLANLCGQDRRGAMPAAWSLAVAGAAPIDLGMSLAEAGVVDGQVLYLRDLSRDAGADAVVADLDETITEEAAQQRRVAWPRQLVVIAFGLVWLVAAAAVGLSQAGSSRIGVAIGLIVGGLMVVAVAWAVAQLGKTVPASLCVLISLTAVSIFAAAGGLLGQELGGDAFGVTGVISGALAGMLLSLAATPEAVVFLIGLQLAAALAVAPILIVIDATGVQVAAAAVVVSLSLLGLAKTSAALVAVWSQPKPGDRRAWTQAATKLLQRSRLLLTVLVAGPAVALAIALPALARSGSGFAIAAAATGSVALLVRARQAGLANEWVPVAGSGLVGLFAVLTELTQPLWHNTVADVAILVAAGLALTVGGAIAAVERAGADPEPEPPAGLPANPRPPGLRRSIDIIGVLCVIATVSLALGVFGVLGDLAAMGRAIIGN